jgi:coenzyme F420-0:L-glutamate ligase / coenzyme F420-1:gamma-L-glutamate ligase
LSLRVWPLAGIPEIHPGDDLAGLIARLAGEQGVTVGDTLMIAHKVASKAEGRIIELATVAPSAAAAQLAELTGKSPQLCELILIESVAIVRRRGSTLICRTHHGFVCANAGIDSSNAPAGWVILLPRDPDASARTIQAAVSHAIGGRVGVIITDTHGRAFRRGLVNIAIGVAGLEAVMDRRGETDREGRVALWWSPPASRRPRLPAPPRTSCACLSTTFSSAGMPTTVDDPDRLRGSAMRPRSLRGR